MTSTYYIIIGIRRVTQVFNNDHELHSQYNYHILRALIYYLQKIQWGVLISEILSLKPEL